MSHELRTPLNSSLILAKLLADNRDGNLTAEQVKFAADHLRRRATTCSTLINDILDLSKIEAGKLDVRDRGRRRSRGSSTTWRAPSSRSPREKRLACGSSPARRRRPPTIETDAQRLAADPRRTCSRTRSSSPSEGEVTLRARPRATSDVAFAVRDTGIGIPAEQHEVDLRGVPPGRRRRPTASTAAPGSGLSISRDLARLLGGDIDADERARAQGSTFTLRPARAHARGRDAPRGAPRRGRAPPRRRRAAARSPRRGAARRPPPRGARRRAIDRATPARGRPHRRGRRRASPRSSYDLAHELELPLPCIAGTADEALALGRRASSRAPSCSTSSLPDHSGLSVLDRLKRNPRDAPHPGARRLGRRLHAGRARDGRRRLRAQAGQARGARRGARAARGASSRSSCAAS